MPSLALATGAGAGEGLETLMKRLMLEQELRQRDTQIAETTRANQASEGLRGREINALDGYRQATLAQTRATQEATDRDRTDRIVQNRVNLRPIGAPVPTEEFGTDIESGVPMGSFQFGGTQLSPISPENPAGEKNATLPMVQWKGTQAQLTADQNADTARLNAERDRPDQIREYTIPGRPGFVEGFVDPITRKIMTATGEDITAVAVPYQKPVGSSTVILQSGDGYVRAPRAGGAATPVLGVDDQPIPLADPAAIRTKEEARENLLPGLTMLKRLGDSLITERGVAQRAKAAGMSIESALGNNPTYRAYQKMRTAQAGNLAVMQQGSRPSDTDILRVWLPLIPDVFGDTDESSAILWQAIEATSGLPAGTLTGGDGQQGGLPQVGQTFNGGRVLKVTPIPAQ